VIKWSDSLKLPTVNCSGISRRNGPCCAEWKQLIFRRTRTRTAELICWRNTCSVQNSTQLTAFYLPNIYILMSTIRRLFSPMARQPLGGLGRLIFRGFTITHLESPHWVGLLWMRDQLVAETSTSQHTTLTRDRHPCPRRDSNPQS
jgi:hypothetical protein